MYGSDLDLRQDFESLTKANKYYKAQLKLQLEKLRKARLEIAHLRGDHSGCSRDCYDTGFDYSDPRNGTT